jgi:hypothetical protein
VALLERRREQDSQPRRHATAETLDRLSQAVADLTAQLGHERRLLEAGVGERRELESRRQQPEQQRQQLEHERHEAALRAERAEAELRRVASAGWLERGRLLRRWRADSP